MRRPTALCILTAALTIFPASLFAQSFVSSPVIEARRQNRILHFVKTHKRELIQDALILGTSASESITSQACLNTMFSNRKGVLLKR